METHHRAAGLALLFLLGACADGSPLAPPPATPSASRSGAAGGKYIVVTKAGVNPRSVAAIAGVTPRFVYTTVLTGFAAELNRGQVTALQHNPNVAYLEPDAPARLNAVTQWYPPSWGLDRIDDKDLPLDKSYVYTSTGRHVTAYVLDTGIRRLHQDFRQGFGTRAGYLPNGQNGDFVLDGHGSAEDCHGHGTGVAGIVGGTVHGVAKEVRLIAARVVDCVGNGDASMAVAAMDWIAAKGVRPSVVNMSLGYGVERSVRASAANLVAAGFFVVAAAGNGDFAGNPINACSESPAAVGSVFTVGATTRTDTESSFSNYGPCVDILAPGSSVVTTGIASSTATTTLSGTSFAAPHVTGVVAQYLSLYPTASPPVVTDRMIRHAVTNTITLHASSVMNGTPNRFVFAMY